MTTYYILSYILLNIAGTYIIYMFIKIFYKKCYLNKIAEFLLYIVYFLITTIIYLKLTIPILMLIINVILLFILQLNYESNMKKKIIFSLLIYLILITTETVAALITGYTNLSFLDADTKNSTIIGLILTKTLTYMVLLILKLFKDINSEYTISNLSWIYILNVPASSLILLIMILQRKNSSYLGLIVMIVLIFIINFSMFYLYNSIMKHMKEKMEREILERQNISYLNQIEIMENTIKTIESVQHDMNNHFLAIKSLAGSNEDLLKYIEKIDGLTWKENYKIYTNNPVINSLLSFKFNLIEKKDISLFPKICIPERLKIDNMSITIILGNLLDNALEALEKCTLKNSRIFLSAAR